MKKIRTKQDFISFLKDLRKDYIENCSTWENKDIESFFDFSSKKFRNIFMLFVIGIVIICLLDLFTKLWTVI